VKKRSWRHLGLCRVDSNTQPQKQLHCR
jgi:hypothetical protein